MTLLKQIKEILEEEKNQELDKEWIRKTIELHETEEQRKKLSPEELENYMLQVRRDLWQKKYGREAPDLKGAERTQDVRMIRSTLEGNMKKLHEVLNRTASMPEDEQEDILAHANMAIFNLLGELIKWKKKDDPAQAKTIRSNPDVSGEKTKVDKSGRKK